MTKLFLSVSMFLLFTVALEAQALIYGKDDRQEIYSLPRAKTLAKSTAMMVSKNYLEVQSNNGKLKMDFEPADSIYGLNLCKEERFSKQPSGWLNCTGFLIGEDLLVTAGHCMIYSHTGGQGIIEDNVPVSSMCENFAWVFDFYQQQNGMATKTTDVSPDRVYSCAKVIYAEAMGDEKDPITGDFSIPAGGQHGKDFAIIQLDRKVTGDRPALKFAATAPAPGENLMVIGYPSALPGKYAMGKTLPGDYANYFTTDLDILEGNSGSPVFNSKNEVTGIIVRGYPYIDYQYLEERQCNKVVVCKQVGQGACVPEFPNEVLGSHVQKAAAIAERLKGI